MTGAELAVVEAMKKYGGSFVVSLAECYMHADATNFAKLRMAFPEYWDEYEKVAKTWAKA